MSYGIHPLCISRFLYYIIYIYILYIYISDGGVCRMVSTVSVSLDGRSIVYIYISDGGVCRTVSTVSVSLDGRSIVYIYISNGRSIVYIYISLMAVYVVWYPPSPYPSMVVV